MIHQAAIKPWTFLAVKIALRTVKYHRFAVF